MRPSHSYRRASTIVVFAAATVLVAEPAGADERGGFGWPLHPRPAVSRVFDNPDYDWLPGHRGVDLTGGAGQQVYSAGDGIVVFAGIVADRPLVSVEHSGGLRTTYEPVEPTVHVGYRVRLGTAIGTLLPGHAGCASAVCLHWGARRGRDYLDPRRLVAVAAIRLKPLHPW